MRPLLLVGGGGHCRACIDVIESTKQYQIVGIVEPPRSVLTELDGYPVIGSDDDLPNLCTKGVSAIVTVGQIESPDLRIRLGAMIEELGLELATVVSPGARVSPRATIGRGSIVMHGAVVGPGARIGRHCIVNSQSLIEHDAEIGDYCHVSTGAIVNGGATVERATFVGSGATVFQGVRIGGRCVIGGGCTIRHNVASDTVYRHDRT